MLKTPMVSCACRLFTLAVLLSALAFLVSTERARATVEEDCDTQYGYCIYQCRNLTGTAYENCRFGCESTYDMCLEDPNYDPLPAPYPVITNNLQLCLQGCQSCNNIQDPVDRLACLTPCIDWCFENNPRP